MRAGLTGKIVAFCLLTAAPAALAQDFGGCARPRPWREVYLHPGEPRAEVSVCLKEKAWNVRHQKVPLRAAAAGIVAQCEVDVTFFAGPAGSEARFKAEGEINDVDNEIVGEATAAVTHYRGCLGD